MSFSLSWHCDKLKVYRTLATKLTHYQRVCTMGGLFRSRFIVQAVSKAPKPRTLPIGRAQEYSLIIETLLRRETLKYQPLGKIKQGQGCHLT